MSVSPKAIAKIEAGRLDLRLSTIARVANALDVKPSKLLEEVPENATPSTIRHRGPMFGLGEAGWHRAKAGTHGAVPVLDVKPRLGRSSGTAEPLLVAWAAPPEGRHPTEDGLFLAQVRGASMHPILKDGDWCLFSRAVSSGDVLGKLVLLREADAAGLAAWCVKRVQAVRIDGEDRRWLTLACADASMPTRDVAVDATGDVAVVAAVREVLTTRGRSARRRVHSRDS